MKLVFNDEFDYEGKPNPTKWNYDIGGHGGGNNELQYYTDSEENAHVKDGKLFIIGKRQKMGDKEYTSAKLVTDGTFSFKYGQIDVSAKLPKGAGSWPAIWMLSQSIKEKDWPLCGEIDIMEHVGKDENMIHVSLHSETYNHVINTQQTYSERLENVTGQFHKYSCQWNEDAITFFYDDRQVARFVKNGPGRDTTEKGWPFDQEFYLILNVAVGGNWGGEVDEQMLPFVMEVEYVRIYQ